MTAADLAEKINAKPSGEWFTAHCPAHDDRKASLSFRDGDEGIAFKCHAGCASRTVAEAMARRVECRIRDFFFRAISSGRRPDKIYKYTDRSGSLLFEVVRSYPKRFRQRRPNGQGGYIWNLKGVER